jgi:hypothetical protein
MADRSQFFARQYTGIPPTTKIGSVGFRVPSATPKRQRKRHAVERRNGFITEYRADPFVTKS